MRQEHEEANGIAGRHVAERPASSTEASFGLSGTVQRTAPFRATAGAAGGDAPAVHARAGGPVHGREHPHGAVADTVVFACYLILHPAIVASLPETQGLSPSTFACTGPSLSKKRSSGCFSATCPACCSGPSSARASSSTTQRGASMAEGADPLSGEQTSPLGSFFFQSAVYLFFSTGAFLALLGVVYALTKSGRSRSSSRSACLRTSTCRCSSPGA